MCKESKSKRSNKKSRSFACRWNWNYNCLENTRLSPPERITRIDTAEEILKIAAENGYSVFLLGGEKGIAEKAALNIKMKLTDINICGYHHGFFTLNGIENTKLLDEINKASPDIIFACMGSPRQEEWILKNTDLIPSLRLSIRLGGSLDVWAKKVKRAPKFIQKISLEWLWRTLLEPRRITTVAKIPLFLFDVHRQKHKKSLL